MPPPSAQPVRPGRVHEVLQKPTIPSKVRWWRYNQAVKREHELIGTRQSVHWRLAYWRRFHQLLAWAFVLGLALHVVLVLFFAGYVADGREVYWWHFTAWDIEWL